jgi:hypothetical protein
MRIREAKQKISAFFGDNSNLVDNLKTTAILGGGGAGVGGLLGLLGSEFVGDKHESDPEIAKAKRNKRRRNALLGGAVLGGLGGTGLATVDMLSGLTKGNIASGISVGVAPEIAVGGGGLAASLGIPRIYDWRRAATGRRLGAAVDAASKHVDDAEKLLKLDTLQPTGRIGRWMSDAITRIYGRRLTATGRHPSAGISAEAKRRLRDALDAQIRHSAPKPQPTGRLGRLLAGAMNRRVGGRVGLLASGGLLAGHALGVSPLSGLLGIDKTSEEKTSLVRNAITGGNRRAVRLAAKAKMRRPLTQVSPPVEVQPSPGLLAGASKWVGDATNQYKTWASANPLKATGVAAVSPFALAGLLSSGEGVEEGYDGNPHSYYDQYHPYF